MILCVTKVAMISTVQMLKEVRMTRIVEEWRTIRYTIMFFQGSKVVLPQA